MPRKTAAPPPPAAKQSTKDRHALIRAKILEEAEHAVSTLAEIRDTGEKDSDRVNAANSLLDRAGIVKPTEAPLPSSLSPGTLLDALTGLGALFGKPIPQEMRTVSPASGAGGPKDGNEVTVPSLPELGAPLEDSDPQPVPLLPKRRIIIGKQEGQP